MQELSEQTQMSLKDSILAMLRAKFIANQQPLPRVIRTHLCLALIDLAIQVSAWSDPIQDILNLNSSSNNSNGINGQSVVLELLKVLPEEVRTNTRIPVPQEKMEFFRFRTHQLLTSQSATLLSLVASILATATDSGLKLQAFECLLSWIKSNDVPASLLSSQNPQGLELVSAIFQMMRRADEDDLWDITSDLIIEIIRVSSGTPVENVESGASTTTTASTDSLVQVLLQNLIQNTDLIQAATHSEEHAFRQRNLTRIYLEAAESWLPLMQKSHSNALAPFIPILRALVDLASTRDGAAGDLQVVPMTFSFWFEFTRFVLSQGEAGGVKEQCRSLYYDLARAMIRLVQYPSDTDVADGGMTAEERDQFREFRHYVGDVLKDCVLILGPADALNLPYQILLSHLQQQQQNQQTNIANKWQDLEAPLFALRAMGAEIPATESQVLPQIMHLLPSVPEHPKLRYACTLVLGRYSNWTRENPQFIGPHLKYISDGFSVQYQGVDVKTMGECSSASALALKYLCESCACLMGEYYEDLVKFYHIAVGTGSGDGSGNARPKLKRYDCLELTEAMAHVLNALPVIHPQTGEQTLLMGMQGLILPLAQRLHHLSQLIAQSQGQSAGQFAGEVQELTDRIGVFFKRVRPKLPSPSSHAAAVSNPCVTLFQELLPLFDPLLTYLSQSTVGDSICRLFKTVVISYDGDLIAGGKRGLLAGLMQRLGEFYERSQGSPCFLWVAGHVVRRFGAKLHQGEAGAGVAVEVEEVRMVMYEMINRQFTYTTSSVLTSPSSFSSLPDVVEDFFRLIANCIQALPPGLFYSNQMLRTLLGMVRMAMKSAMIECQESGIFLMKDLMCEVLDQNSVVNSAGQGQVARTALVDALNECGREIMHVIVEGVCGTQQHPNQEAASTAGIAYSGQLYPDIASLLLTWSDLSSPDYVLQLLDQSLTLQMHQYPQKLTPAVKQRVNEDFIKGCVQKKRVEVLRMGLATLGMAFRERRANLETMRGLDLD